MQAAAGPSQPPRRKRVTYVLPLPTDPLPLLSLPQTTARRAGDPRPLVNRKDGLSAFAAPDPAHSVTTQQPAGHPQHRLGVSALALDLSTIVVSAGKNRLDEHTPRGILYAGGRDGLLSAWELGLPLRKRKRRYGYSKRGRIARGIRWGDAEDDGEDGDAAQSSEEEEDEAPRNNTSPGLAFGEADDLLDPRLERGRSQSPALAYEDRWELDPATLQSESEPVRTTFRQSVRPHSDWINAIVLCNLNRTVISASSDRTVRAWNPHDPYESMRPTVLGNHADYVKTLAAPRNGGWVASGGFDKLIKLWDIHEGGSSCLRTFPEDPNTSSSIYSLATTPNGSLLASGSPDGAVRMWDHRSGKQFGRLNGHTDNVRSILLSEDGSLLLSGSADSNIKLWSVPEQRCIETFSYHSESVWSLFSNHPYLDVFYSGDRSGLVCKVDMEGCRDASSADCVVLLQDGDRGPDPSGADGINSIVAVDDAFVYTATGSSSIKRWRDVAPRSVRVRAKATSPARSPRVASPGIESQQEAEKEPLLPSATRRGQQPSVTFAAEPSRDPPEHPKTLSMDSGARSGSPFAAGFPSGHRAPSLRMRATANGMSNDSPASPWSGMIPSVAPPTLRGLPYESMVPLVSLADPYLPRSILHGEPLSTTWSTRSFNFHRAASSLTSPLVMPSPKTDHMPDSAERQALEQYELREEASDAVPLRLAADEINPGLRGLVSCEVLNDRRHVITADKRGGLALWDIVLGVCLGAFDREEVNAGLAKPNGYSSSSRGPAMPIRDALELIKERIEGEDATSAWSTVDVRSGALSIHLEEARVFEGEQYADMAGFTDYLSQPHQRVNLGKTVLRALFDGFITEEMKLAANNQPPISLQRASSDGPNRLQRSQAPAHISLSGLRGQPHAAHDLTAGGMSIALATPALTPVLPPVAADRNATLRQRDPGLTPIPQSPSRHPAMPHNGSAPFVTPGKPDGADYFSAPPASSSTTAAAPIESPASPTTATNSSLMGRLKGLGRRPKSGIVEPVAAKEEGDASKTAVAASTADAPGVDSQQLNALRTIFAQPLAPCPADQAPPIMLPEQTIIIIAAEAPETAAWQSLYRGTAASMPREVQAIEMSSPVWLLDFLLGNRVIAKEPSKIAFVMTAWEGPATAGVPEMPEGNNRLSANRVLRITKVAGYCADQLGGQSGKEGTTSGENSRSGSAISLTSSMASRRISTAPLTADDLEIMVGDEVLAPTVTLAQALRFWQRKPGDLLLNYRLKDRSTLSRST